MGGGGEVGGGEEGGGGAGGGDGDGDGGGGGREGGGNAQHGNAALAHPPQPAMPSSQLAPVSSQGNVTLSTTSRCLRQ